MKITMNKFGVILSNFIVNISNDISDKSKINSMRFYFPYSTCFYLSLNSLLWSTTNYTIFFQNFKNTKCEVHVVCILVFSNLFEETLRKKITQRVI